MPFINVDSLPIVKEIQSSIDVVKKQFDDMRKEPIGIVKPNVKTNFGQSLTYGNIFTYSLKLDRNLLDEAEQKIFDENFEKTKKVIARRRKHCIFLTDIISKYPNIRQCYFNEFYPKSKIRKHYGVNGVTKKSEPDHFRIQITVEPGNNCFFYIEKEKQTQRLEYKEGLKFGFRDGLDMHWVENNGNETRTVLIIDIDRTKETDNLPVLI